MLRRLDRHVPEQELDLIELAARQVTETGTCTPEVMRSKLFNVSSFDAA